MVKDEEILELMEREDEGEVKGMEVMGCENLVSEEVMKGMGC